MKKMMFIIVLFSFVLSGCPQKTVKVDDGSYDRQRQRATEGYKDLDKEKN